MDPISAVGIALSVAGLAGQVFTGCIQCIHFIIAARDLPKDCQYLNIRLRLEQQRLFAWSEASGLLDYDAEETSKILESNVFGLHRSTVIELLVQIKVLFEDFEKFQKKHKRLEITHESASMLDRPSTSAASVNNALSNPSSAQNSEQVDSAANISSPDSLVPLSPRRKKFLAKALSALRHASKEWPQRLRWASFDKNAFETLLEKFAALNDSMTTLLDIRLQNEIYSMTQDTNRGVLQLHQDFADLTHLVKAALVFTLQERNSLAIPLDVASGLGAGATPPPYQLHRHRDYHIHEKQRNNNTSFDNASGLDLLAQLARFKAYSESMESGHAPDGVTAEILQLDGSNPGAERIAMEIPKNAIALADGADDTEDTRCEADYKYPDGRVERVWIEWKDYEWDSPSHPYPSPLIIERVQKLAALLHHQPKPAHFRVPQCLGYFDDAEDSPRRRRKERNGLSIGENDEDLDEEEEDDEEYDADGNYRIGFVFAKPPNISPETVPLSLLECIQTIPKPSVTDRIALASALANCILYLHAVNWLHKGLRSHNIVFFPSVPGPDLKLPLSDVEKEPSPSNTGTKLSGNHPSSTSRTDTEGQSRPESASVTTSALKIPYHYPYLSGFDFARPSHPSEPTELPFPYSSPLTTLTQNLYRHPLTQSSPSLLLLSTSSAATATDRPSFRKEFDIYALGVVLVEIALWESIDKVLGVDLDVFGESESRGKGDRGWKVARGVRGQLLTEEIRRSVEASVGSTFAGCVIACLRAGSDDAGREHEDDIIEYGGQIVGFEEVVRRLEGIRV